MALETGNFISDLNAANPTALDLKSQGDDHLRLLKAVLLATFPAFNAAVTLTPGQINTLFNRANILGAVSTVAGVPAGAVIERGSNSNGEYVKYADGTLVCNAARLAVLANPSHILADWIFPAPFAAHPGVSVGTLGTAGFVLDKPSTIFGNTVTFTGMRASCLCPGANLTGVERNELDYFTLTAVGRWPV